MSIVSNRMISFVSILKRRPTAPVYFRTFVENSGRMQVNERIQVHENVKHFAANPQSLSILTKWRLRKLQGLILTVFRLP